MKKTVLIAIASLMIAPSIASAQEKIKSNNAKNLIVIVTTNDSVTQLMAGALALKSKKQGANVEMLYCGQAGSLVVKGSKEVILKPKSKSPQMLIKKLLKMGTTIKVCPPYLPNANKTKADLIDGVTVANPSKIASTILDKDTKILSY
jgi:predicted peroxiredoxin